MLKALSPKQAAERLGRGGVHVVDVREPHEWLDGHVPGALLRPLAELRRDARSLLPEGALLFVCAAGVRSDAAARLALQLGYLDVYNLTGGTRAWVKAGLPIEYDHAVTAAE